MRRPIDRHRRWVTFSYTRGDTLLTTGHLRGVYSALGLQGVMQVNTLTLSRSSVLILAASAALSLGACGKKDEGATTNMGANSSTPAMPPPASSNTDRSSAPGTTGTTGATGTAGRTASTGNATDTPGSVSVTSTMGGPAGASSDASTATGMTASPSSSTTMPKTK